ncbi:lipopolysaccharide heptosyltransferase family protein [Gammaproteobacteria bacterium LSUCC0112]|nr:lipopolysaccharide heptosyltransferase family protein [Gammaproteobacteria bacterium LSUCC0112]
MPDSTFFSAIRSILVVRPNVRLGNNLLLTPLLAELEQKFPMARIDILTACQDAPAIFSGFPTVDRVLVFPRHGASHLPAYLRVMSDLLSKQYDLVVDPCPKSRSSRFYTELVRAKLRIGFESNHKPAAAKLFTARLSDAPPHMGKFPVYLVRSILGASSALDPVQSRLFPMLDIRLSDAEIAAARHSLHQLTGEHALHKPVLGIFTEATGLKKLPINWWRALIDELTTMVPELQVLVIVPPGTQTELAEPGRVHSWHSSDVRQVAAMIEAVGHFVCADSGVMHLAASTRAQVVGLFSHTDPKTYSPLSATGSAMNSESGPGQVAAAVLSGLTRHDQETSSGTPIYRANACRDCRT